MQPRRIPIGIDDFRTVRESGFEYVDKTDLVRQLIDRDNVGVVLLPRPRRFGKTLNLSMIRCWFEKTEQPVSHLFEGLSIWGAGDAYRAHFQRYPVIHFNFKGSKASSFQAAMGAIRKRIVDLFRAHRAVLDGGRLDEVAVRRYRQILDGTAEQTLYDDALRDLSEYLHAHHGEKVVLLIDEYDEPIHAGHVHGYRDEILDFMRNFLGEGLKSNPHLHKAVVTGILRVAKENLFSGLNNLGVFTLLKREFNTCFGFTEAEVTALAEQRGRGDKLDAIRAWYNGYIFGGEVVYNPWSVCNYLELGEDLPGPYWVSTSSNDLVHELLERYAFDLQPVFESLLEGGSVEVRLDDNVAFAEIRDNPDALWSLLVFSGYLKAEECAPDALGRRIHRLSIPNHEIRDVYATSFRHFLDRRLRAEGGSLSTLTKALLSGDAETFEEELQSFVTNVLSYHDPGKLRPERVYHGFLVGLLAVMEPGHQVRSNRESGAGRPDVWIRPTTPGKPGVVLELKVAKPGKKTLEQALEEGLSQLATG
ncbi:MAG: AAA family ATPase, partial [Polyangiaceae bacterium]